MSPARPAPVDPRRGALRALLAVWPRRLLARLGWSAALPFGLKRSERVVERDGWILGEHDR